MKIHPPNKSLVDTLSKGLDEKENETKSGFYLKEPKFVIPKKLQAITIRVVTIFLVLFALGGLLFEVHRWSSISRNLNESQTDTMNPRMDRKLLNISKIQHAKTFDPSVEGDIIDDFSSDGFPVQVTKYATRSTTLDLSDVSRTSFRNDESRATEFKETMMEDTTEPSTPLELNTLLTIDDFPSDGFPVQMTKQATRSTTLDLSDVLRTSFRTDESRATKFKETMMEHTTEPSTPLELKKCSEIIINSTEDETEQFPKLFGEYRSVGSWNEHLVYIHHYSDTLLFSSEANITSKGDHYQVTWTLFNKDYFAVEVNCKDLIPSVNSNCFPKWIICLVTDILSNADDVGKPHASPKLKSRCSFYPNISFHCKDDKTRANGQEKKLRQKATSNEKSLLAQKDHENDSTCKKFEFTSKRSIQMKFPEMLGTYILEDYLHNEKLVYVNKESDTYLYYGSALPTWDINENFYPGAWDISFFLNDTIPPISNYLCKAASFPADGKCESGWNFLVDSNDYMYDWSASMACKEPQQVKKNVSTDSVCKKFELTSTELSDEPNVLFSLGEYEIIETMHNGKAVYRRMSPLTCHPVFLYSATDLTERYDNVLVLDFEIGSDKAIAFNYFCGNLEYLENGMCNSGWYILSQNMTLEYAYGLTLQCIQYS